MLKYSCKKWDGIQSELKMKNREHTSGNIAGEGILSCCIARSLVQGHTQVVCDYWDDPLVLRQALCPSQICVLSD